MGVPVRQALTIGLYIIKQKLKRNARFPLVLMLETRSARTAWCIVDSSLLRLTMRSAIH